MGENRYLSRKKGLTKRYILLKYLLDINLRFFKLSSINIDFWLSLNNTSFVVLALNEICINKNFIL